MSEKEIKRLSDVLPSGPNLDGTTHINDVLDRPLVIDHYEVYPGRYGEFAIIYTRTLEDNTPLLVRTGGEVVIKKLRAIANKFPVLAKFVRRKRYYDLVDPEA